VITLTLTFSQASVVYSALSGKREYLKRIVEDAAEVSAPDERTAELRAIIVEIDEALAKLATGEIV
jgi:hypothetical protein